MLCKPHFNVFKIACDLDNDDVAIFTAIYWRYGMRSAWYKVFININSNIQKNFEMKGLLILILPTELRESK